MAKTNIPAVMGALTLGTASREHVECPKGCGTMDADFDAIGNVVFRCRRCRPKAATRRMAPEHSFVPVRLVRESEIVAAQLPVVEPGQLRCQICAIGVKGSDRFCEKHQKEKLAQRSRIWRREHAGDPLIRTCLRCGSTRPRRGSRATSRDCPKCVPVGTSKARIYKPRPCELCEQPFMPTGPAGRRHIGGCP